MLGKAGTVENQGQISGPDHGGGKLKDIQRTYEETQGEVKKRQDGLNLTFLIK